MGQYMGGIVLHNIRKLFYKYIRWLELIIAIFLSFALIVAGLMVGSDFLLKVKDGVTSADYEALLEHVFSLIIGTEFIRMILKPTSGNALEVVLFTIARFLVLDHASMINCLIGVASLGSLFAIRKYLFCEITTSDIEMKPVHYYHANNNKGNEFEQVIAKDEFEWDKILDQEKSQQQR
ncbi:MAG: hypothetical protein LBU32_16995 [Clostridiales bacterium]|jgi:hypothetical protein|nr:hypothetical protein [Clostridiales bacterium]